MGGPCLADQSTHGDDRVGEVEERVDYCLAALVAALEPVERVVPGICPLHMPALAGLDGCLLTLVRDLAGQPYSAPTCFGRLMPGSPAGYGYHWWAVPPLPGGVNNGAFSARGAFGQFIFVNPTEQVVIAIQSAWRQPQDSDAEVEIVAMIRAAVSALRTEPAS